MIRRSGGRGGGAGGWSAIELLIALAIVTSIAGVIAVVVEPARDAFDRVPAELELHQRGRTALHLIAQALRSAGRNVPANQDLGSLSAILPVVSVGDPDESGVRFTSLTVIGSSVDGAQGVLVADQPGEAAPLTLATAPCPNVTDVCGFTPGITALIADGLGRHDVFRVAATEPTTRQLTVDRGLHSAYPAGSAVIEVDHYTFRLAPQSDGSRSLIRETGAGATQPMVDFVTALSFRVIDRRIDVEVTVQATTAALRRGLAERAFKTSVTVRNPS